jgi:hypothetical protein
MDQTKLVEIILKHDGKLYAGTIRSLDKGVRPSAADVDRLLGQQMETALRCSNGEMKCLC